MKRLLEYSTYELVEELKKRIGVETYILNLDGVLQMNLEGPCIILKVID